MRAMPSMDSPLPEPEFDVVLRGYDRPQVDTVIEDALRALVSPGAATITADRLRAAELDVVFRGYDRNQVADYLDLLADRIDDAEPHTAP